MNFVQKTPPTCSFFRLVYARRRLKKSARGASLECLGGFSTSPWNMAHSTLSLLDHYLHESNITCEKPGMDHEFCLRHARFMGIFYCIWYNMPPKTKIALEKIRHPKRKVLSQPPFFGGYVSFRECIIIICKSHGWRHSQWKGLSQYTGGSQLTISQSEKIRLSFLESNIFLTLLLLDVLQEYEMCEASGTSFNFVIEIFTLLTRPPVLPSWRWLGWDPSKPASGS